MMTSHRAPVKETDHSTDQADVSESKSKIDPSFKSKRYRDKLRTEIKALEGLLPVDRTALSRKLDSQTVFRLVISYFRSKIFFKASAQNDKESSDDNPDDSLLIDEDLKQAVDGLNVTQLLDGFLLVITSDGTVLYVSDSILQYLGFNQVDLMHRCIYGVIHPDDHQEVKVILEHTLGPIQLQAASGENTDTESDPKAEKPELCKAVSFLCRMKCFNGTSAGYLKMHCSGKISHLSELSKTNRTSCQVLFLFCHPFMINTTEIDQETKQNVFWSKHDLDLSIRELDKKAVSILGYHSSELEGRSLYSVIHPEDIATCASCHKTLAESNDVQTLYFRLQSKDGGWVWVQSRGKVICKNSKKFSIVFSHCPVREEDSTYIQQESVLRQRYAINDLMCMTQMSHCGTLWKESPNCIVMEPSMKRMCSPSFSTSQEDSFLAMHSISSTPCPSSWHALSDRHSPILPSSHVAHKISQREKQVQFQEFKRRQQAQQDQQTTLIQEPWDESTLFVQDSRYSDHNDRCSEYPGQRGYGFAMENGQEWSRWHPADDMFPRRECDFRFPVPQEEMYQRHMYQPFPPQGYHYPPLHVFNQGGQHAMFSHQPVHNMPPSPPPSPPTQQHLPQQHHEYIGQRVPQAGHMQFSHSVGPSARQDVDVPFRSFNAPSYPYYQQSNVPTPCIQDLQRTAEKYLSYCEYDSVNLPLHRQFTGSDNEDRKPARFRSKADDHHRSSTLQFPNHALKHNSQTSQSCAYAARCRVQSTERSQSQIQTEGHMMIVEHGQPVPARGYMDLPSIGSFLEYLNEV